MNGFEQEPLTPEQRAGIAESDSCFIPIVLDKKKQVYLVHLQAKKMQVTVFTSDEYEDDSQSEQSDAKEFTHVDLVDTAEEKKNVTVSIEGAEPPVNAENFQPQGSETDGTSQTQSESMIQIISDYVVFLL